MPPPGAPAPPRRPGLTPAHREQATVLRTRTRHPHRRDPPRPPETFPSRPRPSRAARDPPKPAETLPSRLGRPGLTGDRSTSRDTPQTGPDPATPEPAPLTHLQTPPSPPNPLADARPGPPPRVPSRPDHTQHHPCVRQFGQHSLAKAHPTPPHSRCAQPSFASVPCPHPRPCGSCFRPVPTVARPVVFRSTSRPYAPDLHTRALPSARHPQHPSPRGRTVSHQFLSESLTRLEALRTLCQQALT